MSYSNGILNVKIVFLWYLVLSSLTPIITSGDDDETPSKSPQVIAPHCQGKCGNVTVPYPFGIGEGCFYEEHNNKTASSFKINCNHNTSPPTPTFGKNVKVLNISIAEGELRTQYSVSYVCYNQTGDSVGLDWTDINLISFSLSSTKNILVAIGCDTYAWFNGYRNGKNFNSGCMTTCIDPSDAIDGECSGIGCCQAPFPSAAQKINISARIFFTHNSTNSFSPCSVAFPVAKDVFKFRKSILSRDEKYFNLMESQLVINWTIGRKKCSEAKTDGSCLCTQNAVCYDLEYEMGYRCNCKKGYIGNAYLPHGCTDVNECKEGKHNCEKAEYCINTIGSYHCKCPKGYHGNGITTDRCVSDTKSWLIPVLATAGVGGGVICLLLVGILLYWKHGERRIKKMRESFFQQNGGMLLDEKLRGRQVDTLKIFTMKDLELATKNYSDENVIGRGGFGLVYKGVLPNKQVVAIKKSLRVDPKQVEQFINEVIVLSQIKNKYVVKLLGCCLESEVPLLVYEFINNGTLYDHLNNGIKASILRWPIRLKIASQVANVLSYLHDTIETPIIHGDMKSMNILLDESYTAKVIDFGASKLITPDQSQFATMVLGTRGYLDPEYLQTSELTEKSDVYSFGVVLVELLTRKKAISLEWVENDKCLSKHFLLKMKEGCLLDILDKTIVSETTIEELQQVANLAKWCLMVKGEERPTMKEVAMELEMIQRKGSHPWNDVDGLVQEDCESLLTGVQRSNDYGGSSGGIESNVYNSELLSSLEIGR